MSKVFATVHCKRQDEYQCGEHVCHLCGAYIMPNHLCYMQSEPPKKPNDKLLFYDFETDFSSGEHIVYAVAQYANGRSLCLETTMHSTNFVILFFLLNIWGIV